MNRHAHGLLVLCIKTYVTDYITFKIPGLEMHHVMLILIVHATADKYNLLIL